MAHCRNQYKNHKTFQFPFNDEVFYDVPTIRFLETDFNTGTIIFTPRISLYYSTHEVSKHTISFHTPTSNSSSTTNFPLPSPADN